MKLDEKSRLAHSGFYLTLVSIMQSLALGYLLQVVGTEIAMHGIPRLNVILQSLVALVAIIMVWHEYAMGTLIYRWVLGVFDSTIPFLIGITESAMISTISIPVENPNIGAVRYQLWLWSIAVFAGAGTIAYLNQWRRAEVDHDARPMLSVPRRNVRRSLKLLAFFFALALGATIFSDLVEKRAWIISFLILVLFSINLVRIALAYSEAQKKGWMNHVY